MIASSTPQVSRSWRSGIKEIGQLGALRHLRQPLLSPQSLDEALKYCNYVFTIVFVFEAALKLVAFGFRRFFKDRWVALEAGQVGAAGGLGQAAGSREEVLFPSAVSFG